MDKHFKSMATKLGDNLGLLRDIELLTAERDRYKAERDELKKELEELQEELWDRSLDNAFEKF